MSITDELRDCIRTANRSYEDTRNPYNDMEILHIPEEELLAIADRIDAAHEKAVTAAHSNGITKYGSMVAREYVKLPVDADGNTINIGDIVALRDEFEVRELVLVDRDLWVVEDRFGDPFNPDKLHHVEHDSWERIIKDAQEYVTDDEPLYSVSELVERCRRLAGGA